MKKNEEVRKVRYTDMNYLIRHTRSNPKLMMEVISVYLKQTVPFIDIMKSSTEDEDWEALQAAMHKIIPSFLIMGINRDFENMARKIQEYATSHKHIDKIHDLVSQLEYVLTEACKELEEELNSIKNSAKI